VHHRDVSKVLAWLSVWCLALAGASIGPLSAAAGADGADQPVVAAPVSHFFGNAAGSREYLLFVPEGPGSMPLVVFLHGCGADPLAYGLDEYAAELGFAVAYPIQSTTAHPGGCWRWREATARDEGEPSIIAGITAEVQATQPIDPARTYLAGHSAGSGMTAAVAAMYPDLYAAVGMVAGCGFRTCSDTSGRTIHDRMGPYAQPVPAYIVWGTRDAENPYREGRTQLREWLAGNDRADDGRANRSVRRLPSRVVLRRGTGGVPTFVIEHYRNRTRCADVDFATGVGAGHTPDFDWPSVFPAMTAFLLSQPRAGCG
jgi:poly(hydroxyalkanoate) depolymerase family esterase